MCSVHDPVAVGCALVSGRFHVYAAVYAEAREFGYDSLSFGSSLSLIEYPCRTADGVSCLCLGIHITRSPCARSPPSTRLNQQVQCVTGVQPMTPQRLRAAEYVFCQRYMDIKYNSIIGA